MGGYGSGGWQYLDARPTTASRLHLDVRRLHRAGLLEESSSRGTSTWRGGSGGESSIAHHAIEHDQDGRAQGLRLSYTVNGQDRLYTVPLEWTPCNYGNARPWARCPNCSRRVAVLYSEPFYCRACHGLTYQSTRENGPERGLRRAQNIRQQLGGSADLTAPFPPKPKGMHWRTYERLWREARASEAEYLGGMLAALERITGKLNSRLRR